MKTKYVRPEIDIVTVSNMAVICTSITYNTNVDACEEGSDMLQSFDVMLAKDRIDVATEEEGYDW